MYTVLTVWNIQRRSTAHLVHRCSLLFSRNPQLSELPTGYPFIRCLELFRLPFPPSCPSQALPLARAALAAARVLGELHARLGAGERPHRRVGPAGEVEGLAGEPRGQEPRHRLAGALSRDAHGDAVGRVDRADARRVAAPVKRDREASVAAPVVEVLDLVRREQSQACVQVAAHLRPRQSAEAELRGR